MRNRKKKAGYERLRPIAKKNVEESINAPGGGNAAYQGEALEIEAQSHREGWTSHRLARPSM